MTPRESPSLASGMRDWINSRSYWCRKQSGLTISWMPSNTRLKWPWTSNSSHPHSSTSMKEWPVRPKKHPLFSSLRRVRTRSTTCASIPGTRLANSSCKSHSGRGRAPSRRPTSNAARRTGNGSSSRTRTCSWVGSTTWKRWWRIWRSLKSVRSSDCFWPPLPHLTSPSASCKTASKWQSSPRAMSSKSCWMPTTNSTTTTWRDAKTPRCLKRCCSAALCSTHSWSTARSSGPSAGLHPPTTSRTQTCSLLKTNCAWWSTSKTTCSSQSSGSWQQ